MMKTATPWVIYTLSDPDTGEVRYVGKAFNLNRRLEGHICSSRKEKNRKARWIESLIKSGRKPVASVVETGAGNGDKAEQKWIAHFRAIGVDLTNIANGGGGRPKHPPERRRDSWIQIRCTSAWRDWLAELAREDGFPDSATFLESLVRARGKTLKFREMPPR